MVVKPLNRLFVYLSCFVCQVSSEGGSRTNQARADLVDLGKEQSRSNILLHIIFIVAFLLQ